MPRKTDVIIRLKPSNLPLYIKMNKRGQIYLIAALIISGLLFGLNAIFNYATSPQTDTSLNSLSREINFEASRVIDSGVINGDNIEQQIVTLTNYYSKENPRSEFATIFGDKSLLTAYYYKFENTGKTCLQTNSVSCPEDFFKKIQTQAPYNINSDEVNIQIGEGNYKFKLLQGENFYIILIREQGSEKYVSSPERLK